MMTVLVMLTIQSLVGAFDNLWHHEITERLPGKPWARRELMLHTAREFLYAVVFVGVAWWRWEGAWAWVLIAILATEIVVTLIDFIVEDRTRTLPPFERILHTLLALNFGAILAVWVPELATWMAQPTALVAVDYGFLSWLFTLFGIGVLAWALRDLYAVVRLGVPAWQRHPMRRGDKAIPRHVLVTGGTGLVGRALVRRLVAAGDTVVVLSRDVLAARDSLGPLVDVVDNLDAIPASRPIDAIVNLAGEPLVGGLWTASRKRRFVESRVLTTEAVVQLGARLERRPGVLINASAIGFYGDRGDEVLTEASKPQDIFMSELCRRSEAAARRARAWGMRECRLRIGMVLAPDGGALAPMALAARFGLGLEFGDGRQWLSWIHIDDLVELILFAIDTPTMRGPVNATSPGVVRHHAFVAALTAQYRAGIRLRLPAGTLRRLAGEMSGLFLASQHVRPEVAIGHGFQFRHAEIAAALGDLLHPSSSSVTASPTAYLNEECAVCSAQLGFCHRLGERYGGGFALRPVSEAPDVMADFGLGESAIRRRLYVVDGAGRVWSGVDAVLHLWAGLPYFRWAARLIALPAARQLAEVTYEGALVPLLAAWNGRHRLEVPRHGCL